jgi:cytochrome c553
MAAKTSTHRDHGAGPGTNGPSPAPARTPPRWRLRPAVAEIRAEAGDLGRHLRRNRLLILGLAAAALLGALLFAWSGIYSVAATSGHYPLFRVFLGFALHQSVETHAAGITVPPTLDDPAMVRRGAAHYQGGCAPCHGAPGHAPNPITRQMLPEPPHLSDRTGDWTDAQLFWVVKHGIKYTGMPAWVAPGREDEVWSVVAFLRRLPEMETSTYRRLALGEADADRTGGGEGLRLLLQNGPTEGRLAACARCHGLDGGGDGTGAFPRLQGQTAAYLYEALKRYARGSRPSGIMQPVAAELDDAEMRLLAAHYAAQPARGPAAAGAPPPADPEQLAVGRRIAQEGLPGRRVAACAGCHGPKPGAAMHPLYPRLAGQEAGYIADQLTLWLSGVRGGAAEEAPLARIMAHAVGASPGQGPPRPPRRWFMSQAEIRAVAAWYAAQPPAESATAPPPRGGR